MTRVVHEHIHAAERLMGRRDERLGLGGVGHVGGHGQGFHAELFGDLDGYRLGGGQAALRRAVHHHVHASGRQLAGHGASDAAGGAGHNGAAAVFWFGHVYSFSNSSTKASKEGRS